MNQTPATTLPNHTFTPYLQYVTNLLGSKIPPVRFLQIAINIDKEKLSGCDARSKVVAMLHVAELGLDPTPQLGHVHFVPFESKGVKQVQVIIGVQGLRLLAMRSGNVRSMKADVVYEADTFEYHTGLTTTLRHVPELHRDRGNMIAAYAVAQLAGGGTVAEVMTRSDILKIKAASAGAKKAGTPWHTHESEMWKKTVLRRLCKSLPMGDEAEKGVATDEGYEIGVQPTITGVELPETSYAELSLEEAHTAARARVREAQGQNAEIGMEWAAIVARLPADVRHLAGSMSAEDGVDTYHGYGSDIQALADLLRGGGQ